MKYERLTPKDKKFHWTLQNHEYINKLFDRLAELEDMVESGQAKIFPCKIGDKAYIVYSMFGDIDEWEVTEIKVRDEDIVFILGHKGTDDYAAFLSKEIGKYAFFTEQEAEAKLKELKGE